MNAFGGGVTTALPHPTDSEQFQFVFLAQRAQLVRTALQRKSSLPSFFLVMSARSTRSTPHQVEKNSLGSVAAADQVDHSLPSSEVRSAPRLRSQGSLLLNPDAPSFAPGSSRDSAARARAAEPQASAAPAVSALAAAPSPASAPLPPRSRSSSANKRVSIADPVPPAASEQVPSSKPKRHRVSRDVAKDAPVPAVPAPVLAAPAPPLALAHALKKSKGSKRPNPPEDDASLLVSSQDLSQVVPPATRLVKRKEIRPPADSDVTPPLSSGIISRHADKPEKTYAAVHCTQSRTRRQAHRIGSAQKSRPW